MSFFSVAESQKFKNKKNQTKKRGKKAFFLFPPTIQVQKKLGRYGKIQIKLGKKAGTTSLSPHSNIEGVILSNSSFKHVFMCETVPSTSTFRPGESGTCALFFLSQWNVVLHDLEEVFLNRMCSELMLFSQKCDH